jgi:hypothetical protein
MDLGWILAPAETTDFSSFADWGFDKEVRQARVGLSPIPPDPRRERIS